jgi:hypothetical protein
MTPWDGLGKSFTSYILPLDALRQIHGDYSVEAAPLVTCDIRNKDVELVPSKLRAIRRTDNISRHFGYVSKVWQPIQNTELFDKFTDLVTQHELRVHHAGLLRHGEAAYMLFKVRQDRVWFKEREILLYLLVFNCFDGETAIKVKPIIVAHPGYVTLYKSPKCVKHSSLCNGQFDVNKLLQDSRKVFDDIKNKYLMMFNSGYLLPYQSKEFVSHVFERYASYNRLYKEVERILDLGICQVKSISKANVWDWYCAIMEFVNYHIGNYDQNIRIAKLWFGENHNLCSRALDFACRIVYDA